MKNAVSVEMQVQLPIGLPNETVKHVTTAAGIFFRHILLPTDFSSTTQLAMPYAVEIARRTGGTIHAVHVIQPDIYPMVPPTAWPEMAFEEERFRQSKTQELEHELQGLPHDLTFAEGKVWPNIAHIIRDKKIDLIVVGTHGRAGLGKVLLGSVAEQIFRQAQCPVLTISPAVIGKGTHAAAAELNEILYATDFTPESLRAARYAACLAREHRADLVLMHAMEDLDSNQAQAALATLRDIVPCAAGLPSPPLCLLEEGEPAEAILRVAERQGADMIVLGVKGAENHVAAATRFSRSTAYSVVTQATCPVLTVRD